MGFRKTVMLLVLMALSVGAGVELGWAWRPGQFSATAPPHNPGPRPWFADQLGLTSDQQKQIDKIWGDARQQMQKIFQQRRDLEKKRESEIEGLLTPDQKEAYGKIDQDIRGAREDLDKQRESMIADANARTRALLDPAQQEKWDSISKDMRRRRGGPGSATQHSTTMPSDVGGHHNHGDHGDHADRGDHG